MAKKKQVAQTLIDQLVDMMPELKDISPWPTTGKCRDNKWGIAVERGLSENVFRDLHD